MSRGNAIILGLGCLGYVCFFLLFPRFDPSADYKLEIGRQEAIEKAFELASELGLEAANWTAYARVEVDSEGVYYQWLHPDQMGKFLTAIDLRIRLVGANPREFLDVYLGHDGSLRGFEKRRPSRPENDEDVPGLGSEKLQAALRLLAGDDEKVFEPAKDPVTRRGATTFEYAAAALEGIDRLPKVTIRAIGDQVYEVKGSPGFSGSFEKSFSGLEDPFEALLVFVILASIILAVGGLARYALAMYDRAIEHRRVVVLFVFIASMNFVLAFLGGRWQQAGISNEGPIELALIVSALNIFLLGPVLLATWGAGAILAESGSIPKRLHFDLLLEGRVTSQPVAGSIAFGGLFSGLLLVIPYLLIASGTFPEALPAQPSPDDWYAWFPLVTLLRWVPDGPLLPIFGIVTLAYPWFSARLGRKLLRYTFRIPLLTVFLALWGFQYSILAGLTAGVLSALLIDWLYRRSGLLTVLSCGVFAAIFKNGMSLQVQPASAVSLNGWLVLLFGFAILAAFGYCAFRGEALDFAAELQNATAEAERKAALRKGERERLLAEFGVARRAQELMLPVDPPQFPGVEISASCTPAREVGGDLFDFLRLEDGRLGIAVADVSGKGVPAALYMTLAKGLLSSVSEAQISVAEVVRQVNLHFHGCAQKRVFATLAMAVLDAGSGVVECARAGHNPILWHRPSKGEIRTVNPSGIGLGLAPDRLFTRSLSVETCDVQEGDVLIIYSDGIPEAMNEHREEYGMGRFGEAIQETQAHSAEQIRNLLLKRVSEFVGKCPASDDVTLVVVRFLKDWMPGPSETPR